LLKDAENKYNQYLKSGENPEELYRLYGNMQSLWTVSRLMKIDYHEGFYKEIALDAVAS